MNDAEVATLSPNTSIEHVGSSAQVMRAGTVLSRDLMQLLAAEVATTAERERNRRLLTVVGVAGIAAISVVFSYITGSPNVIGIGIGATEALIMFASLIWGVRNRAMIDRVAVDAAVSRRALARAVQPVRKGSGPSTALRLALESSSSSASSSSASS